MKSEQEDILWTNRVIQGDTEAFGLLVKKYKDMVFTLALRMVQQREEAEEIAQDVFLKIFKALPKFKQKAKFSTWMYRIAYNECISRLRKKKNAEVSIENIPGNTARSLANEEEDWQDDEMRSRMLHNALKRLSDEDQGLVHLYYFDDLPVEEMAHVTGLSVSNVKIKLFRIRKKLFEVLVPVKDALQI
ncbi:MAG: sigma-70 family RNA polymerase sigma factor [Bacteroidales bacterium]|nr:sigma-70 family RNA polymerase sigma factor [Bacteroidales bacterium]